MTHASRPAEPDAVTRDVADGTIPSMHPVAGAELNEDQRRSQISGGHRLIRLARQRRPHLYSRDEFAYKASYVSADQILAHFVPALRMRLNETASRRVNAAVARARRNASVFGVGKAGVAEFVAEAFFDNWWFKVRNEHVSRPELRDHVADVIGRGKRLELFFPVLSRKPFSPLKNRGVQPDLAELQSLVRLAEATQTISTLSPTGCRLTVLADGFKYNRGCRTPDSVVAAYQQGLRFWIHELGIADIVRFVNYEELLAEALPAADVRARDAIYAERGDRLDRSYGRVFDPGDPVGSLDRIADDDLGQQLAYTFWSIVTSTYYDSLFDFAGGRGFVDRHYGDEVQRLYVAYVSSLHRRLHPAERPAAARAGLPTGYVDPDRFADLFRDMRRQAWDAAVRYVAISLTDRDLNVLKRIEPEAIKLTIHGKKGELHFLSASQRDAAITAQHSTGGLSLARDGSARVTFRYRLERESDGEVPLLIGRLPDTDYHRTTYGPLWHMQHDQQPWAYAEQPIVAELDSLHRLIEPRP